MPSPLSTPPSSQQGAAQLADGSWRLFAGLGTGPVLEAKCEYRFEEVLSTVTVMRRLNAGAAPGGRFTLTGGPDELAMFASSMDLSKLTVVGHSCGGGAAALVAARRPEFAAAVALDPWWPILSAGSPALTRRAAGCGTPLLVVGSEDWNTPKGPDGQLQCGGARQEQVFAAAAVAQNGGKQGKQGGGGGTLFMVPAHTKHHTFSDVPVWLEGSRFARGMLKLMGVKPQPASAEALMRLICDCTAAFCRAHYAAGGPWPAEGSSGGGSSGDAAAAGGVVDDGSAASAAAGAGGEESVGMVTDEAEELAAEAHAQQQSNGRGQTAGVAVATAAAAAPPAGQAAAPLPAVGHVPVTKGEMGSYQGLKDKGLLWKLAVY